MDAIQMSQVVTSAVNTANKAGIWGTLTSIFFVVVYFFLFEENGIEGWKAIIPIYSTYLQYKTFYKKSSFWMLVIFVAIIAITGMFFAVLGAAMSEPIPDSMGIASLVLLGLCFLALIGMVIVVIGYDISICHYHNKYGAFVVAMIFFTPICLAYLAWENRDKLKKN